MKKWVLLFLLLFLPSIAWAGFFVDNVPDPATVDGVTEPASVDGVTSDYGGEDYSDLVFWVHWNNADCSTPLTAYTIDNGTTEYNTFGTDAFNNPFTDDAEINETAALNSLTCGLDLTDNGSNGGDYAQLPVTGATTYASKGRLGITIRVPTGGWGENVYFFNLSGTAAQEYIRLKLTQGDELILYWQDEAGSKSVTTTGSPIAENTQYIVEAIWDSTQTAGNDILEIKVNGTQRAYSNTLSMAEGEVIPINLYFGNLTGNSGDTHIGVTVFSTDITRDLNSLIGSFTDYPG